MAHQELLISWLNDAHAVEMALIPILENHARDAKNLPLIQSHLQQHAVDTLRHAHMIEGCINRLGANVSMFKTGAGTLFGTIQSITTGAFEDELVKNAVADYTAEQFEISMYKTIITAAQTLGDLETVRICQQILQEEEAMAQWLDQNLPSLVQGFLQQKMLTHQTS